MLTLDPVRKLYDGKKGGIGAAWQPPISVRKQHRMHGAQLWLLASPGCGGVASAAATLVAKALKLILQVIWPVAPRLQSKANSARSS